MGKDAVIIRQILRITYPQGSVTGSLGCCPKLTRTDDKKKRLSHKDEGYERT